MSSLILSASRLLRTRSRPGWIGVDLGSQNIKVVQLERIDGAPHIAQALVIPIPPTASLTNESLQQGWLGRLLRDELSRSAGFKGRIAACVLSMSLMEFRSLEVPPGTDKERREMIGQELTNAGSQAADACEFDFWDGPGTTGEIGTGASSVNVLSVSQRLTTQVAAGLAQAGLICRVLDGGPFTLARAVRMVTGDAPGQQPVAALDWGRHGAHFVVIADGQPVFSRILKDCGMDRVLDSVSRGLELSEADCLELLGTCGFPEPAQGSAGCTELQALARDLAAEPVNQLVSELKRTLLYLQHQRPELLPAVISLLGGGAAIKNAAAALARAVEFPVTVWRLPQSPGAARVLTDTPVELLAQAAALSELGWAS